MTPRRHRAAPETPTIVTKPDRGSDARLAMPSLMFQKRFAELVRLGEKRQTIRPLRKRPICVGDSLSLRRWADKPYRSKQIVLREATCSRVSTIEIDETFREIVFIVDGERLNQEQWSRLARDDGFACTTDMLDWFRAVHGLPFRGVLISWA